MGLRFRKSIKLGKGVKLNLNKKSVGLSIGGKGASFSVNSKGRKSATVGIPGTGLSYTMSSNSKGKKKSGSSGVQTAVPKPPMKTGLTPLLITVFLGWAGGHWFISGRAGMGFLYLFTFGLFGIGWMVDLIRQVYAFIIMLNDAETETYYTDENIKGQE